MMIKCMFIFFLLFLGSLNLSLTCSELINHFIKDKHLCFIHIFQCNRNKERLARIKQIFEMGNKIVEYTFDKLIVERNLRIVKEFFVLYGNSGIIIDADCENSSFLLTKAGELNLYDEAFHWMVVTKNYTIKHFTNINFNINVDFVVGECNHKSGTFSRSRIIDLYNPAFKKGGKLISTNMTENRNKISFNFKENKYWRRKNMSGINFKTMAVLVNKFNGTLEKYLLQDATRRIDSRTKFHSVLMNHCKEIYNFSLMISLTNSWGFKTPNGTFDGMTGALESGDIDFGGSVLFLKKDRIPVISHGRSTWLLRTAFLFRNTYKKSFAEIFLHPLNSLVWYTIIICALIIIIILKTSFATEKALLSSSHNDVESNWSILLLITLGAFCQQGTPYTPRLLGGKFTALSLFVFCVLFYQYYSGSMVSFLLTKQSSNIKNGKDLLESPLQIGAQDIVYVRAYFRETTDPIAKELYRKKIAKSKKMTNFFSPEIGLKMVQEKDFAFYVETSTGYPILEDTFTDKSICELEEIVIVPPQTSHIAAVKGSPFLDMLNVCMQYLTEVGIVDRQRKIWDARKPDCIQSSAATVSEVELSEIYPIIILLLLGIIISLIIMFVEKIYYKYYEKT